MNVYYLFAAIVLTIAQLGHLSIGFQQYLEPINKSNLDAEVKGIMQTLFHYVTIYALLSIAALYTAAFESYPEYEPAIPLFIGISWLCFAAISFGISLKYGIFKMYQWIFWLIVGLFTVIGSFSPSMGNL